VGPMPLGRHGCCGFAADGDVRVLQNSLPVLIVAVGHPVDTGGAQRLENRKTRRFFAGHLATEAREGLRGAGLIFLASCNGGQRPRM